MVTVQALWTDAMLTWVWRLRWWAMARHRPARQTAATWRSQMTSALWVGLWSQVEGSACSGWVWSELSGPSDWLVSDAVTKQTSCDGHKKLCDDKRCLSFKHHSFQYGCFVFSSSNLRNMTSDLTLYQQIPHVGLWLTLNHLIMIPNQEQEQRQITTKTC